MSDLDNHQLRSEEETEHSFEWVGESRAPIFLVGAVAVLVLVLSAAGIWYWWPEPGAEVAADLAEAPFDPPKAPAVESDATPAPRDFELPTLPSSDEVVRQMVATVSSHPRLVSWLANERLIERLTRVVVNTAYDEDPRLHVPFLRPRREFSVRDGAEGAVVISSASYQRYDPIVKAFVSLDTEGTVELYRRLKPLFEEAYRQLGRDDGFDDALRRATAKVLATPTLPGEVAVREATVSFRFVDPRLEELAPAQKLLLRTGSSNVVRVKTKIRELANAAGLY